MIERKNETLINNIVKCLNTYSTVQKNNIDWEGNKFTPIDLQILTMLINNKKLQLNMIEMAHMLGLPKSTFSKSVEKLSRAGFVKKYKKEGNDKNKFVSLSEKGIDLLNKIEIESTQWIIQLDNMIKENPERLIYYSELINMMIENMEESPQAKDNV